MANAREIKSRINSVQDTMKITNAMYMISSSKMKKAKKILSDTEPYFYNMQSAIARILRHIPDTQHPFFSSRHLVPTEERKIATIVGATDEFYSLMIQGDKTLDSQIIADQVVHVLEKRHQCAGEEYFQVQSFQDVMQSMNEMLGMVTAFISFVAGISLLVGGIGVMNIMLVSVTERTREIGIRKSLGAKTSSIMLQFLAEAAILTVIGGLIGIILGILAAYGICSVISGSIGMTIIPGISPTVIFVATLFSCAVGVFFGIYPAKKAARLSPIEALRRN